MTWFDALVEQACAKVDDRILETLNARGVSDDQVREFKIGYINKVLPEGVDYPKGFLDWCHQGAKLDHVYVFPLTNVLNEVHGLQFRHIQRDKTGYLDYFESRGEAVLFGLGQAAPHIWKSGSVFLVEGNFDLLPVQRHRKDVVATLTARVVDSLVSFLKRTCKRVDFGYDMDATGRRGVAGFQKLYHREFEFGDTKWPQLTMPNGKLTKDPGDLWELWGDQRLGVFLREQQKSFNQTEWFNA